MLNPVFVCVLLCTFFVFGCGDSSQDNVAAVNMAGRNVSIDQRREINISNAIIESVAVVGATRQAVLQDGAVFSNKNVDDVICRQIDILQESFDFYGPILFDLYEKNYISLLSESADVTQLLIPKEGHPFYLIIQDFIDLSDFADIACIQLQLIWSNAEAQDELADALWLIAAIFSEILESGYTYTEAGAFRRFVSREDFSLPSDTVESGSNEQKIDEQISHLSLAIAIMTYSQMTVDAISRAHYSEYLTISETANLIFDNDDERDIIIVLETTPSLRPIWEQFPLFEEAEKNQLLYESCFQNRFGGNRFTYVGHTFFLPFNFVNCFWEYYLGSVMNDMESYEKIYQTFDRDGL